MPKCLFTVFAGRKRFLAILMNYVRPLLHHKTVDEAHFWDYCRQANDREHVRQLVREGRAQYGTVRVQLMTPPASDLGARFPNKWKGYYAHYAATIGDADLLIKYCRSRPFQTSTCVPPPRRRAHRCDDDIVFIANLHVLLEYARADAGRHMMYYPSVVNNDVSSAFQVAALTCLP